MVRSERKRSPNWLLRRFSQSQPWQTPHPQLQLFLYFSELSCVEGMTYGDAEPKPT